MSSGIAADVAVAEVEAQGDLEHVVDDVVELLGEGVDVLPVERRHERRVEAAHDRPGELVAAVLEGDHGVDRRVTAGAGGLQQLAEPAAALDDVRRGVVEEVEEPVVGREQSEPHGAWTLARVNGR